MKLRAFGLMGFWDLAAFWDADNMLEDLVMTTILLAVGTYIILLLCWGLFKAVKAAFFHRRPPCRTESFDHLERSFLNHTQSHVELPPQTPLRELLDELEAADDKLVQVKHLR